jgi:predicted  nucleic acid-binding Zn-ribbon protein
VGDHDDCNTTRTLEIVIELRHQLHSLGDKMATVLENLAAIEAKADAQGSAIAALAAAFTDLAADVRAALAAAANPSADEQTALDTLSSTLDSSSAAAAAALADIAALDTEVGDADGSDTVPVP